MFTSPRASSWRKKGPSAKGPSTSALIHYGIDPDKRKGFEATIFSDSLINATGYTTQVSQCNSPLLRGMLASGLVRANEFGGVDVDFESGRVLSRAGRQMKGLFALGSLASGTTSGRMP